MHEDWGPTMWGAHASTAFGAPFHFNRPCHNNLGFSLSVNTYLSRNKKQWPITSIYYIYIGLWLSLLDNQPIPSA